MPESIAIGKLKQYPDSMRSQDIASWRRAMAQAQNIDNPNRIALYDLYNSILLDGRLTALTNKRRLNVTNKSVAIHDKNGNPLPELMYQLETPWFRTLKAHILDTLFFGHSLIELLVEGSEIIGVELVPRKHVRPEFGDILIRQGDNSERIIYTEPPNNDYLLSVGNRQDLGLLLKAAQYVIYKRGAFGDWAQYAELFGMPFRIAKYKAYDNRTRALLEKAMQEVGSAAYIVIPEEAQVEITSSTNSAAGNGGDTYDQLRQACNEELAILILGQTMTTTDGSSRSQSETHFKVEEQTALDDMLFLEYVLNWQLKPLLLRHGYPLSDAKFHLPETEKIGKVERLDMLLKINKDIAPIDPQYIAKEFDVPLLDQATETSKVEKKKPTKQSLALTNALYLPHPNCNHTLQLIEPNADAIQTAFDQLTAALHKGDIADDQAIYEPLYTQLSKALLNDIAFDFAADNQAGEAFKAQIKNNIHAFSGAKSYQELTAMRDMLLDDDGDVLPFHKFKDQVKSVHQNYNISHLRAEYQHVAAAAHNAGLWATIEADKNEMPYLQYLTANDEHVRETHQKLNGIIVPVDDPFWDKYYPPNGWRCRCDVVQLSEQQANNEPEQIKTGDDAGKLASDVLDNKKFFGKNFAKAAEWFDQSHPHFQDIDLHKLSAEKDYALKPPKPTATPLPLLSQTEFEAQWQALVEQNDSIEGGFTLTDAKGTKLYASKTLHDHIIKGEKPNHPHYSIFNRAQAAISQPDEIWFGWITAGARKGRLAHIHLKFYTDYLIIVFSDEQLNIITTYATPLSNANHFRYGVLLYRK